VGIICSLLNLAPHEVSDGKTITTSAKTAKDLRSIKHEMNRISNLRVQGEANEIVEDIKVRLQMSDGEINSRTRLVNLSSL
jgi:hypothetical protein